MAVSKADQEAFNQQADQIERALSSLSLLARVEGGQVREDWVRYHLAPLAAEQAGKVKQSVGQVAEALGVYQVRVAESGTGLALDVPTPKREGIRLLSLVREMEDLAPLTALVGISERGRPLLLSLHHPKTWHLIGTGPPGSGKSELLRSIVISLGMRNRQSQIQFLGVDLSGRELLVMESLPHLITQVATSLDYAEDMLSRLLEEMDRRLANRIRSPHIILAIDGLEYLSIRSESIQESLEQLMDNGKHAGVHCLLSVRSPIPAGFSSICHSTRSKGVVLAEAAPEASGDVKREVGRFRFLVGEEVTKGRVAWLPVSDLPKAVEYARFGWGAAKKLCL